jgi:Leucyl-tRNA synthetase
MSPSPWQTAGVAGVRRFLNRAWRLICNEDDAGDIERITDAEPDRQLGSLLHRTIASVSDDIEDLRFNTAIAKLMELVNVLTPMQQRPRPVLETLVLLLSPFAPHIAEEMWRKLGHGASLAYEPWPFADPGLANAVELQEYPVQINGKLRTRVIAASQLERDELLALVKDDPEVRRLLSNVTIVREVVVPGRLVNFVVEG